MLQTLDGIFLQPLMHLYAALIAWLPPSWHVGWRLVAFGVTVNLLLAPVYHQMEVHSRRTRAARDAAAREAERLKRHFKGRERYFYVRTAYRQHGYRPLAAALGSADLFVQILVFATVYRFVSNMPELQGAPFGPITDLARPDALLGGINLLPLLMTGLNALSVLAYSGDRGRRVQGWLLAALFLVLLYGSPAGLVLYWTTNNLFSLLRNLAYASFSRHRGPGPVKPFARFVDLH
jgi:membrane protein insertase Oxa1/YidC/SpoIIIJ